jgi:glycosidase
MWGADDPSNRKPMLWKDLEPYEQPDENHVMDEHLAFYKQVIALRHAHPALRAGDFETLLTDDTADVWAFVRSDAGEQIIVVLNASDTQRVVHIPLPAGSPSTWRVLLGEGDAVSATGDRMTVPVPGVAGIVLQAPRTP